MRLAAVERGEGLKAWLLLRVIRLVSGRRTPDVVRTLLYRPRRFGGPFSAMVQQTLRGPSEWSVGERELFAAFVSSLNKCRF